MTAVRIRTRVTAEEAERIMLAVGVRPLVPYVDAGTPWPGECSTCRSHIEPTLRDAVKGLFRCDVCAEARAELASDHSYREGWRAAESVRIEWIDPGSYSFCRKAKCTRCGFVFFTSTWMVVCQHRGCFKCEDPNFSKHHKSVVQVLHLPGTAVGLLASINVGSPMATLHNVRGWRVHAEHEVSSGTDAATIEAQALVWLMESSNALRSYPDSAPGHTDVRGTFRTGHKSLEAVEAFVEGQLRNPAPRSSLTRPTVFAREYVSVLEARAQVGDAAALRELIEIAGRLGDQDRQSELRGVAASAKAEQVEAAAADGDVAAMLTTARSLLYEFKRRPWAHKRTGDESEDDEGILDKARRMADQAVELGSADGLLIRAEVSLVEQDTAAAIGWYEAAIERANSAEMKLIAGEHAHWKLRRPDLARDWLLAAHTQACDEDARRTQAHAAYQLGWLAQKQGDTAEARHWWQVARDAGHNKAKGKLRDIGEDV